MVYSIRSLGLHGVSGYPVTAECDLSGGLPAFTVVGLPDAAVNEARERVRSAIKNCGFTFPVSRITVNLAPAHLKKAGTLYDLPMLVGILAAGGQLKLPRQRCAFVGELSLSGQLRPCAGMLPMALCAAREGIEALYVPEDNAAEATLAQGPEIYPVRDVEQLARHLSGEEPISPALRSGPRDTCPSAARLLRSEGAGAGEAGPGDRRRRRPQCAHVRPAGLGQVHAGPAAARHPSRHDPGGGPGDHPDPLGDGADLAGAPPDSDSALPLPPPHRLSHGNGGGRQPIPGRGRSPWPTTGCSFWTSCPSFPRRCWRCCASPWRTARSRSPGRRAPSPIPARFMLVCAMNPCRCGWYGHPSGRCRCTEAEVKKYLSRLSGPLLDRIDLFVEVAALDFDELSQRERAESSARVKERVDAGPGSPGRPVRAGGSLVQRPPGAGGAGPPAVPWTPPARS